MPQTAQSGARLVNSLTSLTNVSHQEWLEQVLHLALTHRQQGGRPFAALLVRDNRLVASAVNRMLEAGDPTRHAEMEALRGASQQGPLKGAVVYASGHPCPMCLSALVMNGISAVYYAFDNQDAAPFGFDSSAAYAALRLPLNPPPLPLIKLPSPISAATLYGHTTHE
ncbi:nucleoside deaminase [Aeromonas tecta]|uniref:nucleoside deaminase n=1 Tax=Aeromonas tecta TaxID=324617 RepID=UPI00068280B2|nr:nucleoside deaminase [Aeromonas tecta]